MLFHLYFSLPQIQEEETGAVLIIYFCARCYIEQYSLLSARLLELVLNILVVKVMHSQNFHIFLVRMFLIPQSATFTFFRTLIPANLPLSKLGHSPESSEIT